MSRSRRAVLAAVAGGAGLLAWRLPGAHARAVLPADLSIVEDTQTKYGDIVDMTVRVDSRHDEPIEPVFTAWSSLRRTQHPWEVIDGPDAIPPHATETLRIASPGDLCAVAVRSNAAAQLTMYDRGTERRTNIHFNIESQGETEVYPEDGSGFC